MSKMPISQLYVVSERIWDKNNIYDPIPKVVVVASDETEVIYKLAAHLAGDNRDIKSVLSTLSKEIVSGRFIIQPVGIAID